MPPIARRLPPVLVVLALSGLAAKAQDRPRSLPELKPDQARALDRISADSLKGHLSFLASDLLEGRDTPSRGLDLAAEYIAAQFRRGGLEPVGDDGYFQTASWEVTEPDAAGFGFTFEGEGEGGPIQVTRDRVSLSWNHALDLRRVAAIKVDFKEAMPGPGEYEGKAILVDFPDLRKAGPPARLAINAFLGRMAAAKAAVVVALSKDIGITSGLGGGQLTDPRAPGAPRGPRPLLPAIIVHVPEIARPFDAMPFGPTAAKVSLRVGEPIKRQVKLRNVVGLLRGSDPILKDTCVMVTAHYDHLGIQGNPSAPDRIYNGANDDGSGTVSVIELASSLASLKERPRRSILFATFFGEEKGLLGSRYYGRNPIIPIERTIADLNLEQVGRTDDTEGEQVSRASLTGFGYSDVSATLAAAGQAEGIAIVKHPRNSDAFFGRSDNQALADLGVPAHTLCVAFQFADYHGLADHWDKLDYPNMARVDRAVARALLAIADDPAEPRWDETNPRAARYLKAWKDRRAK